MAILPKVICRFNVIPIKVPKKIVQRNWIDIFPKKTHIWPTETWKDAQHLFISFQILRHFFWLGKFEYGNKVQSITTISRRHFLSSVCCLILFRFLVCKQTFGDLNCLGYAVNNQISEMDSNIYSLNILWK